MAREWPELSHAVDGGTFATLHLVSQMLGKLRVAHAPWANHGWHVTLHPVAYGLITEPTAATDGRSFTLALDLCEHAIALRTSDGVDDAVPLRDGRSIGAIHADLIAMLDRHGLPSTFHGTPNEVENAVPFARDTAPRTYDPASAERLRVVLSRIVPVFARFRAGFLGKATPVHFFWGSFDLAVTRFSGRPAPPHPGGVPGLPDAITREAYSHEVSSAGFWPAGIVPAEPIFYNYAYPEPEGFRTGDGSPGRFDDTLGEFVLAYDQVRRADDPEGTLLRFLENTYAIAADRGGWDRPALERAPVPPQ